MNAIVLVKILNDWRVRIDILLICAALLALCDKRRLIVCFRQVKPWLLVLLVYPIGYLPFFIEGRYIYIEALLILLLLFYLLQELGDCFSVTGKKKFVFNTLVVLGMAVLFSGQWISFVQLKISMCRHSRSLREWQNRLQFLRGERIVTDRKNYVLGTQLCYNLDARLYGVWNPGEQHKVQQYQVKYLLTGAQRMNTFLELREIIPAETGNIYVYKFVAGK